MVSNLPVILSKSLSNHMKEVKADAVSNPVISNCEEKSQEKNGGPSWGSVMYHLT